MFTGLVEEMGEVLAVDVVPEGRRLRVRASACLGDLVRGQSIAVNGVCQTVTAVGSQAPSSSPVPGHETPRRGPARPAPIATENAEPVGRDHAPAETPDTALADSWFEVISVPETLARTTFGSLAPGRRVNLERPLRLGDRLGGHWVQGHVDATGAIEEIVRQDGACSALVSVPRVLSKFIVEKGSIAIDGVSLTVGRVDERRDTTCFWVHLIPETLERTVFGIYEPGVAVNIEADLIGKHVVRALEASGRIPPAGC